MMPAARDTLQIAPMLVTRCRRAFAQPILRLGAPLGVAVVLGACATKPASLSSAAREIDLAAFSQPPDRQPSDPGSATPAGSSATGPTLGAGGLAGDDGTAEWAPVELDERPRRPPRRVEPGDRIIVDGLVGQVNGRPIFADGFFEPIADQLIALRDQVSRPDEYPRAAAQVVMAELQDVVLNALFLAEAESGLTIEQQKGIRFWLLNLESRLISGHEGSEEKARRAILEEEGKSFEAHLDSLRDQALIRQLLQDEIAPRVIVSWRDIEREYRRRLDEFQPDPQITVARIRLASRNAAAIADVNSRLAAGESLLTVAESIGQRSAMWQKFVVPGGDLGQIDIANEEVKTRLAGLREEGDVAGPFEIGAYTWWLAITQIDRGEQRDLYDADVQRELTAKIRQTRGTEEQDRYISSLMDRGIYDELGEMGQRLLTIAIHRYGP